MGRHSTEIVEAKFKEGLAEIEKRHSEFFNSFEHRLKDCYIFQYVPGRSKRTTASASMFRSEKEKELPNEIRKEAKEFMFELFKWVKEQKFTY